MLNTLKTIKNLGILLLEENDKQKNPNDPEEYEMSTCTIRLKKGSIAYKIDNFVDREAVTMSDDIADALDALKKAKVIDWSFHKSDILIQISVNLLREYIYGINGDLINIFEASNLNQIHKDKSIPIEDFNHIFQCNPMNMHICCGDLLQLAYSLLKMSEVWNSLVFYQSKEDLAVKLDGALAYLLNDGYSCNLNSDNIDEELKHLERHKLIDVEPSVIILDTFRFYEWFSIIKNQLNVKQTVDEYGKTEDDLGF